MGGKELGELRGKILPAFRDEDRLAFPLNKTNLLLTF